MPKSKGRRAVTKAKRARKEEWKRMSPEARAKWTEEHERTTKTGYAKRKRERTNGVGASDRSKERKPWWSPTFEKELGAQ